MRLARALPSAMLLLAGSAACGSTTTVVQTPSASPAPANQVVVDLRNAEGASVGQAVLTPVAATAFSPPSASPAASTSPASPSAATGASAVRFHVVVTGLPPGSHGVHVHETGRCDPPDFTSAGGHFNPFGRHHGLANPQGPHAGDLPNLPVGSDGKATLDLVSDAVTLDPDRPTSLRGPAGTSLVIHAQVDNELTDPAGDSGARIACGVISPSTVSPTAAPQGTAAATPTGGRSSGGVIPGQTAAPSPSMGHGMGNEGVGTPLPTATPLMPTTPAPTGPTP